MIVLFIFLFVHGIDGYPSGAPTKACSTLTPLHAAHTPQTSKAPYQIRAELSGDKILVHISSSIGEKFEGFIIQGRSSKTPSQFIDGKFTSTPVSKTINCFDSNQNTLTHVNNEPKMELMTEWTSKEPLKETVLFRATVAKQYDVFWTEIDSNSVEPKNNSAISIAEDSFYDKCFKEEGCVGMPSLCIEREDCDVLLRYHKSADDEIEFNLQGRIESSRYMAMAFSEDADMGEDSVTECIRDGTDVIARESWNVGKSNTRTRDLPREAYVGNYIDGLTSCSWSTPLVTVANGQTYDLTRKNFYILLATGEVFEWRLKYHSERLASSEALNLTEIKVPGPEEEDGFPKFPPPPTTAGHEMGEKASSTPKEETTTTGNSGSCSSMSLVLLIIGLYFSVI